MDQTEASEQTRYLANNEAHRRETHSRWMEQLNRNYNAPGYKDEWGIQQCGGCRYFVPLTGVFIGDWGGCTNPASALDKHVMFEHDGCDAFAPASNGWHAGTYFESERLDVDEEGHLINPRTGERVELEDLED